MMVEWLADHSVVLIVLKEGIYVHVHTYIPSFSLLSRHSQDEMLVVSQISMGHYSLLASVLRDKGPEDVG